MDFEATFLSRSALMRTPRSSSNAANVASRESTSEAGKGGDAVLRPVPKRARDPLATGAIFRASPAALRSPMPQVLQSPQSKVVWSGMGGATQEPMEAGGQQSSEGATGRFGHLSRRFDELYSNSPTPKVLLSRMSAKKPSAAPKAREVADNERGRDATFVTPSPRAPAPRKPAPAAASVAEPHAGQAGSSSRGLRSSGDTTPQDRASSVHIQKYFLK